MSSYMRTALLDALGRYEVPPGPERVNFTFAFAAGWNAAANPEARADSAVPSSHVSETAPKASVDQAQAVAGSGAAASAETERPQEGIWTLTAPDGRVWRADTPLKACSAEQRERVRATVAMQRIMDACNELDPDEAAAAEDAIEAAFWQFDARRKGYAEWRQCPQPERDAFKAEARALVQGYWPTPLSSAAAVHHEAPEPNLPKAEGESILREALARLRMAVTKQCISPSKENCLRVDEATEECVRSALAGTNASVDESGALLGSVRRPRGATERA